MFSKAISSQFKAILRNPSPFFSARPVGDDEYHWETILMGLPNTPYKGGVFKLAIFFHPEYPFKPPKIVFKTNVYHPNVSEYGNILLKVLTSAYYSPFYTIPRLLTIIYEMLAEPLISEEEHVEKEIARQYKEDMAVFESIALAWTMEHVVE